MVSVWIEQQRQRILKKLGAGVDGTYLHVTVDSPYMIPSEGKWGLGSIYTAGALIHLTNSFFIDIFGTYSLIKVYFHDTDHGKVVPQAANISGYSVGIGIGDHF